MLPIGMSPESQRVLLPLPCQITITVKTSGICQTLFAHLPNCPGATMGITRPNTTYPCLLCYQKEHAWNRDPPPLPSPSPPLCTDP